MGGRKKSEKFVATEGTISVTANVSGASVKITTAGAVSSIAEFKMDDLENKAKSAKLQPGEYIVEVSKKGYDTYKETVNVNGDITVNATLIESVKTGAAATVANSLLEYKNTVLVNDNAIVTVVVKDKEGNVVPGKTVVFSATNHIPSDASDPKKALEVKGNNVQTTDANGRVSFVVGFKNPTKESTYRAKVTSADYTAKVLDVTDGTESIASGSVGFAALDLEGVYVDGTKLECGENAKNAGATSKSETYSLNEDGNTNVTYVSAQKVSSNGNNEHEVTFNAKPQIVLPAMASEDKKAEEFVQPVNYKSGDYFTYADSKYDKIIPLEEEASQLKYATLMFNDIKISKHTRLVIDSYTDKECKNIIPRAHKEIDGEHSQTGFGYQLPLNYNVKAVKVSIESAGQVQTDMNTGFDIDKIVGVYKNDNSTTGRTELISSATVNWENVNPTMSDFVKLDADKADDKNLLESLSIATDNNKKFDYQVPVFPYTGDAVIREFDANDKIVNYYLAPTVKETSAAKQHNTNVIAFGAKAYKATEEEATNHMVGSIKADGVKVKVNSTAVGSTNVKGTISLPSLGGDALDATNKYIYTSVQWNPIPKDAAVSTSDAFLALSGQNINVYAQLVDKNGNPVSLKDQKITYSYRKEVKNDSSETVKNGAMVELKSADSEVKSLNKDIAVVNNTNTDVNGKATLTLNSAQANVLDDLKAESENYDVILYIGKEKASTADLYWVNPDLAFKKDLGSDYEVTDNGEKTVDSNKSNASTPWQYAVKAVGNKFISNDTTDTTANAKKFEYPGTLKDALIDINGLNINTTFNEDNKGTYKVTGNGVVDGTSDREYKDIITNEFNGKSVGTDITFKVNNKTYSCVGEGTPNFNAKMNLNVTWEAKGTKLAITSPLGSTVSGNSADNKGEAELYVKVTDATGNNPKSGETVTFKSGTESDRFVEYKLDTANYAGQDSADNTVTAVTDGNGVARVKVKVSDVTEQKSSVITASVKDADQVATTTINWVKYEKAFGLVNAGVPAENEKQIKLTFNNNIEADSLKKDMFEVKNTHDGDPNENKKYEITSVTSSGRYVYLTLKSALPAAEYTVSIKPQTIDSVEYTLCDTKGVKLPASVEKEFYSENTASFNVSDATYGKIGDSDYDVATIKVDGIKCGIATNTSAKKDAENEFVERFVVTVDGKIQDILTSDADSNSIIDGEIAPNSSTGKKITDLQVGKSVLVTAKEGSTIEDASFTIQLKQANKDQKVEIFYLGGTGSKTVKVADDLQYTNYVWNAGKTTIDIEFNRNIVYNTVGGTPYINTTALNLITVDGKALSAADIVGNGQTAPTVNVSTNKLTITLNDLTLTAASVIEINKNLFTDGYDYKNDVETITGLDTTAPTVVADKTTKVPAAGTVSTNATYKFKFSEALDETSKTALESYVTTALTTTSTSTLTTNWNDVGDTLTITFTKGSQDLSVAQLNSGNTISVTDIHGNKGDIDVANLQES